MTTAKTIYPTYGDYNLSVANLSTFAREPRLAQAQAEAMPGGLVAYSGGYSRVYPVQSGRGTYALRCWTADVGDAQERYRRIGAHLAQRPLPYFVEFEYLENALLVKGRHYPVLWMEWAEGPRLREFLSRHMGNRPVLRAVAQAFREMVAGLHAAGISHGDLQDENIIVQDGPGGPRLRLIDYDSLFVPALRGYTDQIIGVSHYQHPRRNTVRTASERVDHFSELVIYLSLLAYEQNARLWNPHGEKQLLFTDADFADPARSSMFKTLGGMTGEVAALTRLMVRYCGESDPLCLEPLEVATAGINGAGGATTAAHSVQSVRSPTTSSAGGVRGSGSWDAFFDGAGRTARSQPGPAVLTAARAAPSATLATPPQPVPPTNPFAPAAPARNATPAAPAAPAAPATPASPAAPAAAARGVDWKSMAMGFGLGVFVCLLAAVLIVAIVYVPQGAIYIELGNAERPAGALRVGEDPAVTTG